MKDRDYYINQKVGDSGVAEIERFNTLSDLYRSYDPTFLLEEGRIKPNSGGYLGRPSKRFDKRLPSVDYLSSQGFTADQARAEEQSAFNRIGNALVNNAVIAGTTAISGTIGLLYGAIDAIANQELSRLYDNPVNREMLEWQEATAKAAPNYYKKGYEESSIWKKLGTSMFWADLIKNIGYTEGMMIPAMLTGGALAGTPAAVQMIGSSLAGAVSEASIEALQAKQDKLNLEDSQIASEYNKAVRLARTPEERAFIEQEYQKYVTQIEDDANQAGNSVLAYNMAILTATNALEWGKLFTRGNKASRAALKAKERSAGIRPSEDGLSLDIEKPWVATAKNLGRRGYQAFTEGTEEVLQDVAVRTADLNPEYNSFNESIFNPEKRELADNGLQALGMAFSQAMKDPETATNFAMGFFTSVLGSPRFRAPKEGGQWRSPATMEGGITEFMRERRDYNRRRAIVNDINTRMADPKFQEYYNGLVRDMDLTEKANQALEAGDEFNFQNYQFASMVSDVIMLDNVGQGKMLDDIIDRASNISDKEIQGLIDSGLFQQNGNPMSVEDVRKKIQENASKMRAISQQYREMKETLEASKKGPEFSKDALENLIYAKMQIRNWRERQKQITDEIAQMYKSLTSMMNEEDVLSDDAIRLTATIPETRKAIREAVNESSLTEDEKENWNSKLDDLDRIQKNVDKFRQKVNEYYKSPEKANREQDKIKKKAVEKDKKKKSDDAKTRLAEARSPRDFRRIYREIENEGKVLSEDLERAVNELIEEEDAAAVADRDISNFYRGAVQKLSDIGLSKSEISDAIQMLKGAIERADSLEQLFTPTNPSYTQLGSFFTADNPMGEDAAAETRRFYNTQANVYKAVASQLKELGKTEESARFTVPQNSSPKSGTGSETTGNSGVSSAPAANSAPAILSAEVTSEDGLQGISGVGIPVNQEKEGITESPDTMIGQTEEVREDAETKDNRSWFPLSWFYIGARRLKGTLIPITDTEALQSYEGGLNFGNIAQWLEKTHTQEYIDSGNLKVGDKLVLGIPADLKDNNGNPVIVYYKIDGENRIPVGVFTASGKAAQSLRNRILSDYKSADQSKDFMSRYTTTVNDVKDGYIQYGTQRTLDSSSGSPLLAVVKGNRISLGKSSIPTSQIRRPRKISEKNGMVFIVIPGARKGVTNGYRLASVKVKSFNETQFPLDDASKATDYYKGIQQGISMIISAKTQKELLEGVKTLSDYLYMKGLNFYLTNDGKIRLTRLRWDAKGNPKYKNIKLADGSTRSVYDEQVLGTFSTVEDLEGALYKLNLRFQIDESKLNTPEYDKAVFGSGILMTNAATDTTVGGWFTVNQIDENGNEIDSSKIGFPKNSSAAAQPSSTPSSSDNTLLVTVNGRQMILYENGDYQSLATGQRKSPKTAEEAERNRTLYSLYKVYGEATEGSTMWDNKAVVGDRVIDRTTGEWLTGEAAQEVRNHVESKTVKPTTSSTSKVSVIYQNHDNMDPIDDVNKDSDVSGGEVGYYLDSRDGKIHKTSMVEIGEILGIPVSLFKIPIKSKGINSKEEHIIGYNYGVVLPNGQSFINQTTNPDLPVDKIFPGFKSALENSDEVSEKFRNLANEPSVFTPAETPIEETDPAQSDAAEDTGFELDNMFDSDAIASIDPTTKLRKVDSERPVWNEKEELEWLAKVLPNIPVEVRQGIFRIAGENVWGEFNKAGIILSNVAAEGTAYHEAFHAVFSLGLSESERQRLLDEAVRESGISTAEAEEWLAERFREFVINRNTKSIGGRIKKIFRRLLGLIKGIFKTNPYRYSIYRKIAEGGFSDIKRPETVQSSETNASKKTSINTQELIGSGHSEEFVRNATPEMLEIMKVCKGM